MFFSVGAPFCIKNKFYFIIAVATSSFSSHTQIKILFVLSLALAGHEKEYLIIISICLL
jgi:hypothetical protein